MKFLANQITATTALSIEKVHYVIFNTINFVPFIHSYINEITLVTEKLTYRYAFTLLKMKNAEGRNEYMDLAKEANLLWHQIVSQKSKNTPRINCRA